MKMLLDTGILNLYMRAKKIGLAHYSKVNVKHGIFLHGGFIKDVLCVVFVYMGVSCICMTGCLSRSYSMLAGKTNYNMPWMT